MLQDIRDNSQGTIAKVIIGLICATFALVGVESLLGGNGQTKAAEVNGTTISVQELQDSITLRQRSLMAQMGERVDPAALDANKLAPQVLQSLVDRNISLHQADNLGFEVSKAQMNLAISENPQFQQDGKFSQDLFNVFTQSLSISPSSFSDLYHSELIINQMSGGIISSAFISDASIEVDSLFTHQTRDVRFIRLTLADALKKVQAADEEVKGYYSDNPSEFMSSEKVQLEYVELKLADFVKPPTDKEVEAAYQAEIAAIDLTPTRQVAHILIDPAMHDSREVADTLMLEIKEKLNAGAPFKEIAKNYSDDFGSKDMGGFLGELSAEVFPLEFYDAAELLQLNEVSDIIETESGLHLITVVELTVPEVPTLEERKEAIALALSDANASPAFWSAVEELKDVSFNAPDLTEPAELLGIDVKRSALIDRDTTDALFSNPVLLEQAFSKELINDRVNSELLELSPEHSVVLRVVEHKPQSLRDFDTVEKQAKQALLIKMAKSLLSEQSKGISEQLILGQSIESVAKAAQLDWQAELSVKRGQNKLPPEVAQAAFSAGYLTDDQAVVGTVALTDGYEAIYVVSNVQDGKSSSIQATEKTMMQTYLAQNQGALEYQSLRAFAKEDAEVELFR